MPHSHPQHAAPNPNRNIKAVRTVRFWATPLVITVALMSALCALYLGGILNNRIGKHVLKDADPNWTAGASYWGQR